jgi:hypothetical protein
LAVLIATDFGKEGRRIGNKSVSAKINDSRFRQIAPTGTSQKGGLKRFSKAFGLA